MSMKGSVTTADYLPYADYQKLVQTLINEKKYWGLNFVLWGFALFLLIAAEKLGLGKLFAKFPLIGRCYTLFFIPVTWIIFAASRRTGYYVGTQQMLRRDVISAAHGKRSRLPWGVAIGDNR